MRWIEMNGEDRRRSLRTFLPSDRQSENGVLVIKSFHSEFIDIMETKCHERMVPPAKIALRIHFIRNLPHMQVHP